jgi:WW domain-containing oxidoreductase
VLCAVVWLQGAATSLYLCTSPDIKSNEYYADCNIAPSTAASHDADLGARLWEMSEKLVAQVK